MKYNPSTAFLSDLVYKDDKISASTINSVHTDPAGIKWTLVEFRNENTTTGYQGAMFVGSNKQVVLVSRGTEFIPELNLDGAVATIKDFAANAQMAVGKLPNQFNSASQFYARVQQLARDQSLDTRNIVVAGHSLGGSLSQMLAVSRAADGVRAETYNAYGAANLIASSGGNSANAKNIVNFVHEGDFVSVLPGSKMPGTTYSYSATPAANSGSLLSAVADALDSYMVTKFQEHKIARFLDSSLQANSGKAVIIDVPNATSFIDAATEQLGKSFLKFALNLSGSLTALINSTFLTATSARPAPVYYDPLAIDLDGDGIETIGINPNSPVVTFDHTANGVRTGTGWVTGDDAWLVLDRNKNGSIDTGRELFGVNTLKANGQLATSGLDALRDLDSNKDGTFNSKDKAFTQVRLWQDLNQDGVSQSNELFTLKAKGITAIGLGGTAVTTASVNLGNGNVQTAQATVTRSNKSTTTAHDLNLHINPFFRSITKTVTPSAAALALPDMGGAGWVRDLREAMSLGTAQAKALVTEVQQFAAAKTRAGQMAELDELIYAWAASNEFVALPHKTNPNRRFVVAGDAAG